MKERLIELIADSRQLNAWNVEDKWGRIEDLADYLLANGVIVPPCKVGQSVYRIAPLLSGKTIIVEGEVFEIAITHEHISKIEYRFYFYAKGEDFLHRQCSLWCNFDDFGKTVFLTKEEAEKALAERSEGK